jgi:hypothetical protein
VRGMDEPIIEVSLCNEQSPKCERIEMIQE